MNFNVYTGCNSADFFFFLIALNVDIVFLSCYFGSQNTVNSGHVTADQSKTHFFFELGDKEKL